MTFCRLVAIVICLPLFHSAAYSLGNFQIGGEYPFEFDQSFSTVTYKGAEVATEKEVLTEGGSGFVGYSYLLVSVDSIQQKFRLDTDENEQIVVSYDAVNIGIMFKGRFLGSAFGAGYGQSRVECRDGCSDYYTHPGKSPIQSYFGLVSVAFLPTVSVSFGAKYLITENLQNTSESDPNDVLEIKDATLTLITVGLFFDF